MFFVFVTCQFCFTTVNQKAYERAHHPLKALNLMESMQNDGYDFYSVKVLNKAFKTGVKVINAVGQNFATPYEEKLRISRRLVELNDEEEEEEEEEE